MARKFLYMTSTNYMVLRAMMDNHMHIPISFTTIATICFFLLTATLPQSRCREEESKYTVCSRPFNCGNISSISYPFWGNNRPSYCGGTDEFELRCDANQSTLLQIGSQKFRVLKKDPLASRITMVRTDLVYDNCSSNLTSTSLDNSTVFSYDYSVKNIFIFYNVTVSGNGSGYNNFSCKNEESWTAVYGVEQYQNEGNWTSIDVGGQHQNEGNWASMYVGGEYLYVYEDILFTEFIELRTSQGVAREGGGINDLKEALDGGFVVDYTSPFDQDCFGCRNSKGECGMNDEYFTCHCPDGSDGLNCYGHSAPPPRTYFAGNSLNKVKNTIIGAISATAGVILICVTICCFRCKTSTRRVKEWFMSKRDLDIEAFLKSYGAVELKRYRFSDIKRMTNSFKVKLGQGGFGVVYKGKLLTGNPVAVKMLNASKGNHEEFINEVVSIRTTSHINVVTLLGFCLEGHKKALIYEFMANGSLEKFIYKKGPENTLTLSWENLYQIAIGIAQGLEYLHRGCNTRILHLDIKPHNILLDENFCPKISDFGLSKLCPKKESIISLSDARGTMGYVAPEVWNRHFGRVSHKSDVYSYGMMLLEMVGGRKNINVVASHTSEIYFPHWAYKRLEQGPHLEHDGVLAAIEENEIVKRMSVVGLWCVQTIPDDRPTMSKVIDMLKGSMNSLKMPPTPILSSPTVFVPESSAAVN